MARPGSLMLDQGARCGYVAFFEVSPLLLQTATSRLGRWTTHQTGRFTRSGAAPNALGPTRPGRNAHSMKMPM